MEKLRGDDEIEGAGRKRRRAGVALKDIDFNVTLGPTDRNTAVIGSASMPTIFAATWQRLALARIAAGISALPVPTSSTEICFCGSRPSARHSASITLREPLR